MQGSATSAFFHTHFLLEHELGVVFVLQLPFSNFPLFLKTLGAEYLPIVYLAAMALTRSMRWFGATFGSIMLDFPFFCFKGIEARKISLYSFRCFWGRQSSEPCVWDCFSSC